MSQSSPQSSRTALVTGANKGIGFEISRQLGKAGYTVLVAARNRANGQQAAEKLQAEGLDARFLELDLARPETIAAAKDRIAAEFGHLDILVNNAGIIDRADGLPSTASLKALENTMQTNFFGAVAVTQALLPLVRNSAAGRIVNVSSGLGSLTQQSDPNWQYSQVKILAYCASKAALNMFTVQLAYELRDTKIKVNSADPGYTATDLNDNSGPQTVEEGAAEAIRLALLDENGPTGSYSDKSGIVPW